MKLEKIKFSGLNARQKEIFNFHKVAGILVNYGFDCMRLYDDWKGADFIATHNNSKDVLFVQLKSRVTIDKKYQNKGLYMTFPIDDRKWCLILHDDLVKIIGETTNWLESSSWKDKGGYSSGKPNIKTLYALKKYIIS